MRIRLTDQELSHHGLKGQRWTDNTNLGHADKGQIPAQFHKTMTDQINSGIQNLSKSDDYQGKDLTHPANGKLNDAYEKDATGVVHQSFDAATKKHYGPNASGTKKAVFIRPANRIDIVDKNAAHAVDGLASLVPNVSVHLKRSAKGHIMSHSVTAMTPELVTRSYDSTPAITPIPISHGEEIANDILEQSGVKGMKWGVRHDPGHEGERATNKKIAKVDRKFEKASGDIRIFIAVHNAAAEKSNNIDIPRINNKPEYKGKNFNDPKNAKLRDKYENEHQQAFLLRLGQAAQDLGTNASGTREMAIHTDGKGGWNVFSAPVIHAATSNGELVGTVDVTRDATGHITKLTPAPVSMTHAEVGQEFALDILEHHGVKGQKWGVRRSRSGTSGGEHASADAKVAGAHAEKAKAHGTSALSNAELKQLNERLNLETQFKNLSNQQKGSGEKFATELLKRQGNQQADKVVGHVIRKGVKLGVKALLA